MRAVLYARVSGDDRKYATSSVEGQLADCRRYAAERGYQVVGEFHETPDKLTSGADWLPELNEVLTLAEQGFFDVLVVREIDRLARNRFKQMSVEIQLESHGVHVEYVKGQYEQTAEGRLLKGLMSEFAEYEREKIKERMVRGMVRSVEAGNVKVSQRAPFGYSLVKENGRRTFAVNEEEAATVRLIFDMYANKGETIYAIAAYLTERNVPKPASARKGWSHGTLHNILRNETYAGTWHYRKTREVKDKLTGKKRKERLPKSQWLAVDVPAIISHELFEAAQERARANKKRGKQRKNTYALGGLLKCARCGRSMAGLTKTSGRQYYACLARFGKGRYGLEEACDNPYHHVRETDAAVWNWVKGVLLSPERLRAELANYEASQREEARPQLGMIKSNEQRLGEAIEEKERLIKAYAAGALTLDEIAVAKTEIDKRIADLTQAIANLRAELAPLVLSPAETEAILSYAEGIQRGAGTADDNPERQQIVYRMIHLQAELDEAEGGRWADVTCVLGKQRVSTTYSATSFSGIFPPWIASS